MKQQWPDNIFLLELDCWEWTAIGMCRGQAIPDEKQKCPAASMHIYAWGICASCTAMLCLSSQTCRQSVGNRRSSAAGDCPEDPAQVVLLWLARSDPSEDNAEVATDLWDLAQTQLRPDFLPHLVPYLGHQHSDVRVAAARALAAGVQVSRGNKAR